MNEQDRELQRRLRELLSVPERDRSDEQWDEIIELEIQLAPGNRIDGSNPMRPQGKNMGGGGGGGGRQGRSGGRQNRPRGPGGGNANGNVNPNQSTPTGPAAGGSAAPQGEGRPAGANRSKRRKPANKTPKPPTPTE